jgi:mycothiol synthase
MTTHIQTTTHLDADQISAALQLITEVTKFDGCSPLSEHVLLHLHHGGDTAGRHVLATDNGGELIGYAHLDTTDAVDGPSAELAVRPEQRRHGVGRTLVEQLIELGGPGLRLWAHGEHTRAADLAAALGFNEARVLWQMRRSLLAPLPSPQFPVGVSLRSFDPKQDREAWLELNRRAFATIPDQGRWSPSDLDRRIAETWFDPAGFLLAYEGQTLLGAHWTKVHGHHGGDHETFGEVYVLSVDPIAQGRGLGRSLLLAGLAHLRDLGLNQAMLYVDAANTSAIALYEGAGFVRWDTDILYRHP